MICHFLLVKLMAVPKFYQFSSYFMLKSIVFLQKIICLQCTCTKWSLLQSWFHRYIHRFSTDRSARLVTYGCNIRIKNPPHYWSSGIWGGNIQMFIFEKAGGWFLWNKETDPYFNLFQYYRFCYSALSAPSQTTRR